MNPLVDLEYENGVRVQVWPILLGRARICRLDDTSGMSFDAVW